MLAVKRVLCYKEWALSRYTSLTSMFCKMTARHETQRSSWSVMLKERSIHSSTRLSGGSKLMKMLAKKKRKQWYESPVQATALQPGFLKPSKRNKEDSVRVRTLNNIIYKAVTDLLSSYEVNSEISAYNIQISKVSLPPDFSACRIYWKTSLSAEQDSHIQQALDKCAPRIRHLLISHQILGSVPPVIFIRDKQYAAITEIENLLKKADFGPDENNLHLSVSDIGAKLQPIESGDKKRPVLFGVDHDALHKQIEAYKREKGARDSLTQSPAAGGLTQAQLDTLADIRKQKLVEKKKQKSKWMKDDDITPKDFLLSRSLQKEDKEEQDSDEDSRVDSQLSELMEEEDRRH
ncbi:putative ribosome-binding factor A, mitochondrial [Rhinichthys klamathensis goyatoka]|uniref:putative ribosome-binding factor A, mitochondrial n=1 Tax=Rhinichthys klamathensis goyatoka TaxID=3034132 RepID=UPI0024B5A075|nr:putative ribosome-binding factor A, mitochondrial [Rhinichthys klamathensis goyatoka]